MIAPNLSARLEAAGPFDPAALSLRDARAEAFAYWVGEHGYANVPDLLTLPEGQHKLGLSERPTCGLSLLPASASGLNVCGASTRACRHACVLMTAGRGAHRNTRRARELRTRFLAEHPQAFVTLLAFELVRFVRLRGPADFRPNVASDLRWERIAPGLFELDGLRVYDYTKLPAHLREPGPNYHLTYSVSEREVSEREAVKYLKLGRNAAVVFATLKGRELPATWLGFPVIDGDVSDSRVDDPAGVVVGLRAKGSEVAAAVASGFAKPDSPS